MLSRNSKSFVTLPDSLLRVTLTCDYTWCCFQILVPLFPGMPLANALLMAVSGKPIEPSLANAQAGQSPASSACCQLCKGLPFPPSYAPSQHPGPHPIQIRND